MMKKSSVLVKINNSVDVKCLVPQLLTIFSALGVLVMLSSTVVESRLYFYIGTFMTLISVTIMYVIEIKVMS